MIKLFIIVMITVFSPYSLAYYYNSVSGLKTGLSVENNTITASNGTDVWLCSTRANNRDLVYHVYGVTVRDIKVSAKFIGYSESAVGVPTVQQCRDATDERDSNIKVANYRLTATKSVSVNEGDYNVCWSGWDGTGNDAKCYNGLPIVPVDDCKSEITNYANDLGTIVVNESVERTVKVADITMRCKTVNSITVEVEQNATSSNVLQQEIIDGTGKRLEGLVVFTSGLSKSIFMRSSGTPTKTQNIEDTVVVIFNYQ